MSNSSRSPSTWRELARADEEKALQLLHATKLSVLEVDNEDDPLSLLLRSEDRDGSILDGRSQSSPPPQYEHVARTQESTEVDSPKLEKSLSRLQEFLDPGSPHLKGQSFGYEHLLSDVGRAYCGYDESYFKQDTVKLQDAAQTRKRVQQAPTPQYVPRADSSRLCIPRDITDEALDERLYEIRRRVEGGTLRPLPVYEDPPPSYFSIQPPAPPASFAHTTSSYGNKMTYLGDSNPGDALKRAFDLARKPVTPPLIFSPLAGQQQNQFCFSS